MSDFAPGCAHSRSVGDRANATGPVYAPVEHVIAIIGALGFLQTYDSDGKPSVLYVRRLMQNIGRADRTSRRVPRKEPCPEPTKTVTADAHTAAIKAQRDAFVRPRSRASTKTS